MKKIGILTFSNTYNYGATLQAFAVSEILKEMGHSPIFIDYTPSTEQTGKQSLKTKLKRLFLALITRIYFKKDETATERYKSAFDKFRERNMLFTATKIHNAKDAAADIETNSFDAYVVGSDWVWQEPFDKVFFLDFLKNTSATRIAFAASAGKYTIEDKAEFKRLSNNFDFISLREKDMERNAREITGRETQTIPDPTLLFDSSFWSKYAGDKPIVEGDYILVYSMKPRKNFKKIVSKCKRALKMKTVGISFCDAVRNLIGVDCDNVLRGLGPSEFLNLIKNAKFVITSSFHGTVFSMIFHVPFYSYTFSPDDKRMENLIESAGLDKGLNVKTPDQIKTVKIKSYNFEQADKTFLSWKENAKKFLSSALDKLS